MDRTLRNVSFMALVLFTALASSCSGAQKKNEPILTAEEFERNAPPPDDPCVGQKGAPLECGSQADCCKGYACGKDPERNPRQLYCLKE
jgi:hypothetical protein